jgi:hypothetical protein
VRVRLLAVITASSLTFAGAAQAGAPSAVTIRTGTLTHGNAASLATVDGDTLDVTAWIAPDGSYRITFDVSFSQEPVVHYTAMAEGHTTNCKIGTWQGGGTKVRLRSGRVKSGTVDFSAAQTTGAVVSCKSKGAFALHWDQLVSASS